MAGLYFSVRMHTGGCWGIKKGRKHYEGGSVKEFDKCHTDLFNLMELEGMLLELQWCHTDVRFWFKPKGRHLHDGFELKGDRDLLCMFDDMRRKKYTKVDIYVDDNSSFGVHASSTSDLDASGKDNMELAIVCAERSRVDNDTPGPMLKRCTIEELPDDEDIVVDARVSAQPDDYVMSKAELRDLEEELQWAANLEAGSGEADDGEGEFIMYMPDMDMEDLMEDLSDQGESDVSMHMPHMDQFGDQHEDSDSSIEILEDEVAIGQSFGREAQSSKV